MKMQRPIIVSTVLVLGLFVVPYVDQEAVTMPEWVPTGMYDAHGHEIHEAKWHMSIDGSRPRSKSGGARATGHG